MCQKIFFLVCLQRWIKVIVNLDAKNGEKQQKQSGFFLYFSSSHLHTYKISGIISIHFYGKTGISRHGCCCVYAYDVILLLLLLKRYLTCHKLPNHCIGLMSIFCRISPVSGNIIDLTQKWRYSHNHSNTKPLLGNTFHQFQFLFTDLKITHFKAKYIIVKN